MDNLKKKYLKYKIKYLKLKSQIGGLDKSPLDIEPTNIYKIVDSSGIEHKFKLIKKLGEGTSGTVSLIQNTVTLENRIIKISNHNNDDTNENILFEAEFLEDLNKHVSGYCTYKSYYYGIINGKNLAYLISDYLGQDLFIKNRDLEPNLIPGIIDKIINCTIDINKYLYHRDLKLDNIMIDNSNNVKIIDYGLSIKKSVSDDEQLLGYINSSPERIFRIGDGKYNLLDEKYIKNTTDYYGLFWIIINLICKTEVLYKYIKETNGYTLRYSFDSKEYKIILNFYLDILDAKSYISNEENRYNMDLINQNLYRSYQSTTSKISLDGFINFCISLISQDVLTKLFNNNSENFKIFIKKLIDLLLHIDPRKRVSLIEVRAYLITFFFPPPPPPPED